MADINLYLKNFKKSGDNIWFEKIYLEVLPQIYRYFYLKSCDRQLSEDLASEVFLRVYKNLRKTNLNEKTFSAWIYRIAYNLLMDHYRKKAAKGYGTEVPVEELARDLVEENAILKNSSILKKELGFDNLKLLKGIAGLTKLQRDAVILKFVEDFDYATIAEILGKRQSTVRGILFRAINCLKNEVIKNGQ
jgi:RNA polymerase sigma-70 factor, ECF subfamily